MLLASLGSAVPQLAYAQDTVARLIHELDTARSFKVRVQAAHLLSRVNDVRVVPALARALASDREEVVREVVARLLGGNPGKDPNAQLALAALNRASKDRSAKVRRAANAAQTKLANVVNRSPQTMALPTSTAPPPPTLAAGRMKLVVGRFAGHGSPLLREQLRRQVTQELQRQRRVLVVDRLEPDVAFVVEGTVKKLSLSPLRNDIEASCAVDLVLSRPTRGILLVASGEAAVQRMKASYKPQHRAAMEEEAMVHAVRSAYDNLAQFLARQ